MSERERKLLITFVYLRIVKREREDYRINEFCE